MQKVLDRRDVWQPADGREPVATDLEVCVRENGELVPLVFPCRKRGADWVHARSGRSLTIRPSHWRSWNPDR